MAHRYEKREKHTGVGGIVKHLAYCPICNAVVEPKERRTSRRGTHSTVWFEHEHPLSFISLFHSSRGHSSVSFEGEVPEEVKKAVVYLWVWERCDVEDVARANPFFSLFSPFPPLFRGGAQPANRALINRRAGRLEPLINGEGGAGRRLINAADQRSSQGARYERAPVLRRDGLARPNHSPFFTLFPR
jgi:hypothetical protein